MCLVQFQARFMAQASDSFITLGGQLRSAIRVRRNNLHKNYVCSHIIWAITRLLRRVLLRYLTYLPRRANAAATQSILDFAAITRTGTHTQTYTGTRTYMKNLLCMSAVCLLAKHEAKCVDGHEEARTRGDIEQQ